MALRPIPISGLELAPMAWRLGSASPSGSFMPVVESSSLSISPSLSLSSTSVLKIMAAHDRHS
jgi:hypothetical protein